MGGDLNLKKSWHPSLMSNQKKVWEEEKRALDERKKIDQIRKEREEERQLQELQRLQEASGGIKRQARVDWMYSGPSAGQAGTSEETEAFLLGKRRVDTILQGRKKESVQKAAAQDAFLSTPNANTLRDTASKVRDDPLLAIKRQEQAAYEAMMNDPVKRRMLLKAVGQGEQDEPDRKRRKHHRHHSSRHRDDQDVDRQSRHRSSRHERSSRRRWTSQTPSRSRSRSRDRRERPRFAPLRRQRSNSRSSRERSRSPPRILDSDRSLHKARSWHQSRRRSYSRSPPPTRRTSSPAREDNAAARLAAMQQDASELDQQRQKRLQDIDDRDMKAVEADHRDRLENARYDGRADFVDRFHKRAGDLSLSERMGRRQVQAIDT